MKQATQCIAGILFVLSAIFQEILPEWVKSSLSTIRTRDQANRFLWRMSPVHTKLTVLNVLNIRPQLHNHTAPILDV